MTRVRNVDKNLHKIYLDKASEFFKTMKYASGQNLWISTGLNGIHCTISLCDALTAFYLRKRSASTRHEDVIVLLRKINLQRIESKIKQVLSILSVKNLVEYEAREFRESDAIKIANQVERLFMWTKDLLPE